MFGPTRWQSLSKFPTAILIRKAIVKLTLKFKQLLTAKGSIVATPRASKHLLDKDNSVERVGPIGSYLNMAAEQTSCDLFFQPCSLGAKAAEIEEGISKACSYEKILQRATCSRRQLRGFVQTGMLGLSFLPAICFVLALTKSSTLDGVAYSLVFRNRRLRRRRRRVVSQQSHTIVSAGVAFRV
jgi:hypothetical protein